MKNKKSFFQKNELNKGFKQHDNTNLEYHNLKNNQYKNKETQNIINLVEAFSSLHPNHASNIKNLLIKEQKNEHYIRLKTLKYQTIAKITGQILSSLIILIFAYNISRIDHNNNVYIIILSITFYIVSIISIVLSLFYKTHEKRGK